MRLRPVPISVIISISFVAVFCLALFPAILGAFLFLWLPGLFFPWPTKIARRQDGSDKAREVLR
jgi:hypothetical protein